MSKRRVTTSRKIQVRDSFARQTVCVKVQNQHFAIHDNFSFAKGCLTIIQREPSNSGHELYSDHKYKLVLHTLEHQNKHFVTLSHTKHGDLQSMIVHSNQYVITNKMPTWHVEGLDKLANSIMLRHFTVPCLKFPTQNIHPATSMDNCHDVLRTWALQVQRKQVESNTALKQMSLNNVVAVANTPKRILPNSQDNDATHAISTDCIHRFYYFNNNLISRLQSIFPHNDLMFARTLCLTAAFAHAGKHVQSGVFIPSLWFYHPVSSELHEMLLRNTPTNGVKVDGKLNFFCECDDGTGHTDNNNSGLKAASFIKYITNQNGKPEKVSVPVFAALPKTLQALCHSGLSLTSKNKKVSHRSTVYLVPLPKGQVMLLGNVKLETSHQTSNQTLANNMHKNLDHVLMKRMWLHASLHNHRNNTNNTHNANVKQLLDPLLKAVSPHTVNYSQQNVPVLDLWLHQTTD